MKDIFCIAAFAGKLLGLFVFLNALRPDSIVAVQASMVPAYCKIEQSQMQGCDLNALTGTSHAVAKLCSDRPSTAHC
jgi:hypothetical protein